MLAVGFLIAEVCANLTETLTVDKHSGDPGLPACLYLQRSEQAFAGEQKKPGGLKLHFHHDLQQNLSGGSGSRAFHITPVMLWNEVGKV